MNSLSISSSFFLNSEPIEQNLNGIFANKSTKIIPFFALILYKQWQHSGKRLASSFQGRGFESGCLHLHREGEKCQIFAFFQLIKIHLWSRVIINK